MATERIEARVRLPEKLRSDAAQPAPRGISISLALVLSLGALVVTAVLAVLAISLWSGIRSTIDVLEGRAGFTLDMVENRIEEHLAPAKEQVRFVHDLITTHQLDPNDDQRLRDILTGALAATPQVDGLVFIDPKLRMRAVLRVGGGAYWVDEDHADSANFRALIEAARGARSAYWSDLVWSDQEQQTYLTLRQPVYVDDQFIGMLGAGVSVANLSAFIARFESEIDGNRAFVLYDRTQVLAHTRLTQPIETLSSEHPLPDLQEIGDPVLAAIWSADRVEAFGTDADSANPIHEARVAGENWYYLYREITGYGEKPWIVGSYFRGQTIDKEFIRLQWAAVAGVVVLIIAVVAAWFIGRGIARPVERLAVSAQRIGAFDFDRVSALQGSRLRELNDAASAFNVMLSGLRWFESYVPRKLVRRLMGENAGGLALTSEERDVTVMFTDVMGFTALVEALPAAETAAFLNAHFALIGACVEAEGGTVDKYIGDSVMAFWGAPEHQRDHAARACRAARAIAERIRLDNERRRTKGLAPVCIRVGIHSGPAVVGNIGAPDRINYTIVGDTVNTCSRIERLVKTLCPTMRDAAVLISGDTRARLAGAFDTVSVGIHPIRGRSEGIEVFRLV